MQAVATEAVEMKELSDHTSSQTLGHQLRQRIEQQGAISFAEYMDRVLYAPECGYYAAQHNQLGAKGDFFTSAHLGRWMGELLAVQLEQMWQNLGCPQRFTVVEMGAGQGLIAADILRSRFPKGDLDSEFWRSLEYCIVERSPQLKQRQQAILADLAPGQGLRWTELSDLANQGIVGCFFSNELLDAFPVHRIVKQAGRLQEIYVAIAPEDSAGATPLVEICRDLSTKAIAEYLQALGVDLLAPQYEEGYCTEVNLQAQTWMADVAAALQQGYVLTIDYGYNSARYYQPRRREGTLQCYYRHSANSDFYQNLGQQDITAHVNFTAIARRGEQCGLETLGFTQQGLFLMALGAGDRLLALQSEPAVGQESTAHEITAQEITARLQDRDAIHKLIHPDGLGGFGVLIQAKNLPSSASPLRGLDSPIAPLVKL
jgi:SAM-dependent MidA family methyltransferase